MNVQVGIEQARGQLVAARQPFADREVEVRQALVGRIAVPAVDFVDHDLPSESGHRALRLADRHVDQRQVRRRRYGSDEGVQPRKRKVGQRLGQARIEHSRIQWPNRPKQIKGAGRGRPTYRHILWNKLANNNNGIGLFLQTMGGTGTGSSANHDRQAPRRPASTTCREPPNPRPTAQHGGPPPPGKTAGWKRSPDPEALA